MADLEFGADVRGLRKATERVAAAAERIAGTLERAFPADVPDVPTAAPMGCQHPAESRIDFGITGGEQEFECRGCGKRFIGAAEVVGG